MRPGRRSSVDVGGSARGGVPAEGAAEAAGAGRVHQLGAAGDGREREAAAERLAGDEQVGLDVVVVERPELAGAAGAGLHLVVDPEDPVGVEQLAEPPEVVGRHRDEPAFALHGLEHRARDGGRVDLRLQQPLERGDRIGGRDPAELVGGGDAVDLGRERPEAGLVDDLLGHRQRQQRPAVEAAVEDDHRRAPRRVAGDLDGVLDRLGAAVQQDRLLLLAAARRELGEPPADLHVGLVRPDHEALMEIAVDLLVNRLPDRRVPVPEVEAADAAGEVEVLAAVRIPDERALGAGDDERRGRDAPGDVLLSRPADPLELAAFLQGHEAGAYTRGKREAQVTVVYLYVDVGVPLRHCRRKGARNTGAHPWAPGAL